MKVNKVLMDIARKERAFDKKLISELTVAEFKKVFKECLVEDRHELKLAQEIKEKIPHYLTLFPDNNQKAYETMYNHYPWLRVKEKK